MSEWIQWHGGECPVARDASLSIRFRDGCEMPGAGDDSLRWSHSGGNGDIVAYRIVETEAHMMSAPDTVRPDLSGLV